MTTNHTLMKLFGMTAAGLTLVLNLASCQQQAKADNPYTDVTFDSTRMYSRLLIESRLQDFYTNKTQVGLNVFDANGNLVKQNAGGPSRLKFDYVVGLVTKAVIEAADYYQDSLFARPWFYSVQDYANTFASQVPVTGGSLDDLNASKMYSSLYDLTAEGAAFAQVADASTHQNSLVAMQRAVQGLADANRTYVIKPEVNQTAAGGWWHKKGYVDQMWLDGQYMGPALLAQLQQYGLHIADEGNDWALITRQFDITWHYLWDTDKQLLWHAFSADPTNSASSCWADPETGRSAEYWGRACGWYFLALVDVLEQMPTDQLYPPTQSSLQNYSTDCRTRLLQYLEELAAGLKARQDEATGCWYQLLAYDGSFSASKYQNKSYSTKYNYLEASASAIFIASYLKAIRLGLLPADEYLPVARKAYQGFVAEFVKQKTDGSYELINSCASAGLGGSNRRDGSAAYYLLGSDVTKITSYTEGKVLGAFILAAVEYERMQARLKEEASGISAVKRDKQSGDKDSRINLAGQPLPESYPIMLFELPGGGSR